MTAATPWESAPLARALGLAPAAPRAWQGEIAGRDAVLLETGMGRAAVESALGAVLDSAYPFSLVVSAGLCGALQPDLAPGDLVLDCHGAALELAQAARPAAERAGVALHIGAVAGADAVLAPREKRALALATRAAAVDMESAAVRSWAAARGAEFVAARAVFDALDDTAPAGAPEDGSWAAGLRYAARHWAELPSLLRAGIRSRRAMDALGRFLAEYLGASHEHA